MAELLGHDDIDIEHDEENDYSYDEWDGMLISEYQDWPVNDRKPPRSSMEGEYWYAHENPGAWDHYSHPTVSKEAARLALEADAELAKALGPAPRHLPGKHNQQDHAGKGHKGGTAVKDRPKRKRITASEARGNSRPVSEEEFDALADEGDAMLAERLKNRAPIHPLNDERTWNNIKDDAYSEALKSWGGATIDPHTGRALPQGADKYAITVKKAGMETISVREHPTPEEFHSAMDQAKERYRSVLENQGSHLGVFHDDENHRIDIDPVVVVDTLHEVEAIGAATHAIGGAYHFKSGDGFWPPHVAAGGGRARQIGLGEEVHWLGPGDWHTYAVAVQE